MPYATYRFNKIIAAETIRFIVTVAIVVYKGLKLVVYRMLTFVVTNFDYKASASLEVVAYKPIIAPVNPPATLVERISPETVPPTVL